LATYAKENHIVEKLYLKDNNDTLLDIYIEISVKSKSLDDVEAEQMA